MARGIAFISILGGVSFSQPAPQERVVDAGSFGVYINGQRLATETFVVKQSEAGSTSTSTFRTEATPKAEQTSELQLAASGDLRQYEWKELSPEKAQATLSSEGEVLIQHSLLPGETTPAEHTFLLPAATTVLDDYFFVQRELLLWRFLATACRRDSGRLQCPAGQKHSFPTVNPHQLVSMSASVEFTGPEKVRVGGTERDASRFELKTEAGDWSLWLDQSMKLVKIEVAGDATEIMRD
jgi:hypothetical protein